MTSLESKYTTLRKNALAYYEAVVYPCDGLEFDRWNPQPRDALDFELARIDKKERAESGKSSW